MLLLIDNYDSFTYNLVHYLGELGAESVVVRNDKITTAEVPTTFDSTSVNRLVDCGMLSGGFSECC